MAHRKTVRHFYEIGHLHELTFSCYQRMPLLTNDTWREKLARCLDAAGQEAGMELVGFVFMPEHVHLLVFPKAASPDIGRYLARIKQPFSKQIKGILAKQDSQLLARLAVLERPGKTCFRFWQEGPGFDRNLFSPEAITSSLEYIHNNPVNRGLCRQAVDWKWLSARFYLEPPTRPSTGRASGTQDSSLPMIHGLPEAAIS